MELINTKSKLYWLQNTTAYNCYHVSSHNSFYHESIDIHELLSTSVIPASSQICSERTHLSQALAVQGHRHEQHHYRLHRCSKKLVAQHVLLNANMVVGILQYVHMI